MKRINFWGAAILIGLIPTVPFSSARAAAPTRLTYQGRILNNTGTPVTTPQTIKLTLKDLNSGSSVIIYSNTVTPSSQGEFSVSSDPLPPSFKWDTADAVLEVQVGAEVLTPNDTFGITPYSIVTTSVTAGGVTTNALANGAVTDVKVSTISASKIMIPGTNLSLDTWKHPAQPEKIDASKLFPPIVGLSGFAALFPSENQVIQASNTVTPLTLKGKIGAIPSIPVFDVYDNVGALRLRVGGGGSIAFDGPVGFGTLNPAAAIDVESSTPTIVLRNTNAPTTARAWQFNVNPEGNLHVSGLSGILVSTTATLSLNRAGLLEIPEVRSAKARIETILSTQAVVGALTTDAMTSAAITASTISATSMNASWGTLATAQISNESVTNSTITNLTATNFNADRAVFENIVFPSTVPLLNVSTQTVGALSATTAQAVNLSAGTLANFPAFSVYSNANQTFGTASFYSTLPASSKIKFQLEDFDSHNTFDTTNWRATPPVAGVYSFSACVSLVQTNSFDFSAFIVLVKNGATRRFGQGGQITPMYDGTFYRVSLCIDALEQANGTTDFFEVYLLSNDTSIDTVVGTGTSNRFVWFSGHRVR